MAGGLHLFKLHSFKLKRWWDMQVQMLNSSEMRLGLEQWHHKSLVQRIHLSESKVP